MIKLLLRSKYAVYYSLTHLHSSQSEFYDSAGSERQSVFRWWLKHGTKMDFHDVTVSIWLRTDTEHSHDKDRPKLWAITTKMNKEHVIRMRYDCWISLCHSFLIRPNLCWGRSSEAIGPCAECVQILRRSSLFFWTVVGSEICSTVLRAAAHSCTCYKRAQH